MKLFHEFPPDVDVSWDWQIFGRGVTVQEVATRFGWSVGVATEEMEMLEEKGRVCREQGVDGLRYWENWIVQFPPVPETVDTAGTRLGNFPFRSTSYV
jgi:ESCRT-II complex subunit VPS36